MKLEAGSTGSQTTKRRRSAISTLNADLDPDSVLRSSVTPTPLKRDEDLSLIQTPMEDVLVVSLWSRSVLSDSTLSLNPCKLLFSRDGDTELGVLENNEW